MKIAIIILDEKDKVALLPKLEKLRENAEDEIFICTHNLDLAREIEEERGERVHLFSSRRDYAADFRTDVAKRIVDSWFSNKKFKSLLDSFDYPIWEIVSTQFILGFGGRELLWISNAAEFLSKSKIDKIVMRKKNTFMSFVLTKFAREKRIELEFLRDEP